MSVAGQGLQELAWILRRGTAMDPFRPYFSHSAVVSVFEIGESVVF